MASKYIQMFPIPEGFPEILNDLAKEVIRNQPEDIIEFAAMYFTCLQQGTVLDYPKKGKNIPCDFRTAVPTLKIPNTEGETPKKKFEKNESPQIIESRNDKNIENNKLNNEEIINASKESVVTSPADMREISSKFVVNILSSSIDHINSNLLITLGDNMLLSERGGRHEEI
jgi:hypothetical protein